MPPDPVIKGIGWINAKAYGSIASRHHQTYLQGTSIDTLWKDDAFFPGRIKNFSRFDAVSKITTYAVMLALHDAGIEVEPSVKTPVGVISTNAMSSLQSNEAYFRDYIDSGRTLGRANLFIYTLPTSPLSEVAIHFGFSGPTFYVNNHEKPFLTLLEMGERILIQDKLTAILLVSANETEGIAFYVTREESGLCSMATARAMTETPPRQDALVAAFSTMRSEEAPL